MILCHEKQLIFLKTKKTSGTSFEIAMSSMCGAKCIITPISKVDEEARAKLGFRGPQNYTAKGLARFRSVGGRAFYNHIPATQLAGKLSKGIWNEYRSFSIVRNPYERAISRYYWDKSRGLTAGLDFQEFFHKNPEHLTENMRIAPFDGPNALDFHLRYEHLEGDLDEYGMGDLWPIYRQLKAKAGYRPHHGATAAEMYDRHPSIAKLINKLCHDEVVRFDYGIPDH